MALLPMNLHLSDGDLPELRQVFPHEGRVMASAALGAGLTIFATPRQLRLYADVLQGLADDACRQEDALTDEPLPFGSVA